MAKTNLQVISTGATSGKKITTTLTYVNEEATSEVLTQFGRKLNALTTNNYGETNRIQSINVDTEQIPVVLKDYDFSAVPNFTISKSQIVLGTVQQIGTTGITAAAVNGGLSVRVPSTEKGLAVIVNALGTVEILTATNYTLTAKTINLNFHFAFTTAERFKPQSFTRTLTITE